MFSTLADDSIVLHYQPLADAAGRISGFEALMRWHHQQRGNVSPEAFIPIFESNGLIVPLSHWALRQACRDAASWTRPLPVSINLSSVQFGDAHLLTEAQSALRQTGLPPSRLQTEIKQQTLLATPEPARALLVGLADIGIKIALDDYDAGPECAGLLQAFPFSKVKIDAGLVARIGNSAAAESIICMIVELAHAQGLVVAAKGVETDLQRDFLKLAGCDLLQGFLIGSPGPADLIPALIGSPSASLTGQNYYVPEVNGNRGAHHAHSRS